MDGKEQPAASDMSGDERRADVGQVDFKTRDKAIELAKEAALFCERHPDVWRFIEESLTSDIKQGRRASMQRAVENARRRDFLSFKSGSTPIDNRIRAFLARRFEILHPEAHGHIETRRSLADALSREELLGDVVA